MIAKKYVWLLHVLGCIIFLSVPFFTSHAIQGDIRNAGPFFWKEFLQFCLLVLFFYLNYFLLIPKLYFERRYLLYFLILAVSMWLIAYLPELLLRIGDFKTLEFARHRHNHHHSNHHHGGFARKNFFLARINHNFFLFIAVAFSSLLLRISNRWKQAQREHLKTELSFLKAQINPHFLFNTLNSIYSLAIQKADTTPAAVQKLSAMMRYVLNDTVNNYVPLEKEIEYISNYIDLQRLRFGKDLPLQFTVKGDIEKKDIAPLILMPFIENAFKYGVNAEDNAELVINISIEGQQLVMMVKNNIVKTQWSDEQQIGIGLTNTRTRLNLIYPGKHSIEINKSAQQFIVNLSIALK